METSFIPLFAIIAVLIIAFLLASLPQINHKTRYRVLYAIAIIMLLAVIPISEYMAGGIQNSSNNYLLVLIFDIAVGYFCMYIAALLKFNVLKRKNQALENALTEKQQENVAILLEHQNEKQQALQQGELEWLTEKIKVFTEEEQEAILASALSFAEHDLIVAPSINIQPKETCSQQELMYFVCSAFYNMDKSRSEVVGFLYKVFPLYFPAGESALAKKMPGLEKVKERMLEFLAVRNLTKKGESPIKGGGRLVVIDGGFCRAYHEKTGIAGYTLVYSSRTMSLRTHQPFESAEKAVNENLDILSQKNILETENHRILVEETDEGEILREKVHDLKQLVRAYQLGWIKETRCDDSVW